MGITNNDTYIVFILSITLLYQHFFDIFRIYNSYYQLVQFLKTA